MVILGGRQVEKVLSIKDFKPTIGESVDVLPQTVYDGDTFHGIYYNTKLERFVTDRIRIARINAAEMKKPPGKTETEEEKKERIKKAITAREALIDLVVDKPVRMTTIKFDQYSRPVCEVEVKGGDDKYLNVSTVLLERGIVEPYNE